ncbi:hypothetical protein BCR37DRAFT_203380 [Protomyces lactucae-debilis]|uniref:Uncharacterized protein n=1 Tax=Protomyces lactucae-debilis TaxID=2754530 RepID=A0A1Y2FTQ7_PROLT|nr:uncharacterized protein BCR37DRAFT_203380 [Protomyces lactucae-debilis]ORY86075.1 hypothetical protein BCR37DRAFT_203380 [Protomyces lactucae-debilis]
MRVDVLVEHVATHIFAPEDKLDRSLDRKMGASIASIGSHSAGTLSADVQRKVSKTICAGCHVALDGTADLVNAKSLRFTLRSLVQRMALRCVTTDLRKDFHGPHCRAMADPSSGNTILCQLCDVLAFCPQCGAMFRVLRGACRACVSSSCSWCGAVFRVLRRARRACMSFSSSVFCCSASTSARRSLCLDSRCQ